MGGGVCLSTVGFAVMSGIGCLSSAALRLSNDAVTVLASILTSTPTPCYAD